MTSPALCSTLARPWSLAAFVSAPACAACCGALCVAPTSAGSRWSCACARASSASSRSSSGLRSAVPPASAWESYSRAWSSSSAARSVRLVSTSASGSVVMAWPSLRSDAARASSRAASSRAAPARAVSTAASPRPDFSADAAACAASASARSRRMRAARTASGFACGFVTSIP